MCFVSDSRRALELLESLQEKLHNGDDPSDGDDLAALIYMLDSPLFSQLLNLQDAIQHLKQVHQDRPLGTQDFDFDHNSGELILHPHPQEDGWHTSGPTPIYDEIPDEIPVDASSPESILENSISSPEEAVETVVPLAAPVSDEELTETPNLQECIEQMSQGRQVETIQLYKAENSSLGFSVVGLRSQHRGELGIFVQEIQPGGIAARSVLVFQN